MNEFDQEMFELKRRVMALEQRQREREMDDIRQRIDRLEAGATAKRIVRSEYGG